MAPRKCLFSSVLLLVALAGSASGLTTVNGAFDGSVFFNVTPSPDPPPQYTVQWIYPPNIIFAQLVPGGAPSCTPQYRGRCELYNNGSLRLDNLTYADQREYSVIILDIDTGYNYQNSYNLSIYSMITVAPVLTINSTTPNELVGGTYLTLHCDAGNQNVTTYTFLRNGKAICSEPHLSCQGQFLHFQPITGNDNGNYRCTVENPISQNTSNSLQLHVVEPVSGVTLTTNASDLVWPGIDSVSLHCSAKGTNVIYTWSLQGAPLPSGPPYHLSQNNTVLTISPVSTKDNGTFTCTATNSISSETSNGVNLTLASPVSEVTLTKNTSELLWVGQGSVTLHCSALGSVVHFSWNLNGQPVPREPRYVITQGDSPPNSNLTINPVSKIDEGLFTCLATNKLNSESSNTTLNLAWRPEGDIICTAEKKEENVQLGCSWPDGRPAANVTLSFLNITGTEPNSVFRQVPFGNAAPGTQLNCSGDQFGTTSIRVLKFELPQSTGHDNNKVTQVEQDKSVDLKVSLVDSGLPATFSWFHDNPNPTPIKERSGGFLVQSTNYTSTLQILKATQEDNGRYECRATNVIGSQNFYFNLNVTKVPAPSPGGLDGGAIAGIVIGVLAGITLIGVLVFFLVKRNKRKGKSKGISEPEVQLGNAEYAVVNKPKNKQNGGAAETTMTNTPQESNDDVKYAVLNFPNQASAKSPNTTPPETEYSEVKISTKT